MGYIAWNSKAGNTPTYRVEIMQRKRNIKGDESFNTFMLWEQTENFFKLNKEYKSNPDIFIKITELSNNGTIIKVSDHLQAYPLDDTPFLCATCPEMQTTAVWKCNGKTYAYEIQKLEPIPANGGYVLSLSNSASFYDSASQIGVPFYLYYDYNLSNFSNPLYTPGIPNKLKDNNYTDPPILAPYQYTTSTGGIITGPLVIGIEKEAEEFWASLYSSTQQSLIAGNGISYLSPTSTLPQSALLSDAITAFNIYAPPVTTAGTTRPQLTCIPYPAPLYFDQNTTSAADLYKWLIDMHKAVNLFYWCSSNSELSFWEACGTTVFEDLGAGDPKYNSNLITKTDRVLLTSNYTQFVIERIDQNMPPIILQAKDIYLSNGTIVLPNIGLKNDGLYQFKVFLKNGEYLPFTFEINQNNGTTNTPKQVDLVNIVIYPVPSKSPSFTIKYTATENVNFTYQLKNMQGEILYQSNYTMLKGEVKNVIIPCNYPTTTPEMLINSFNFTDGSTKNITTLYSQQ